MPRMARRDFLVRAAGTMAVVRLSHMVGAQGEGPVQALEWPDVVVARGANKDIPAEFLKSAIDALGGMGRFVSKGQTVAIKPNATWDYPPGTASSTDPELLRALILMVREAGAKRIIVMDHCTLDPGSAECLRITGIGKVLDELGVEKVFPDRYLAPKETWTLIDLPQAKAFPRLGVIKQVLEADVRINMGLAKSHLVTKLTLALKHMMGFLEVPAGLHADLEQGIADINSRSKMQAQLHILEAIRVRYPVAQRTQAGGEETELTDPQRVKRVNEVVVGTDPVLMDAYGVSTYFSRKPEELAHVKLAYQMGLGEIDVDKAKTAGRLAFVVVGQKTPTPTLTRTPVPTQTGTPQPTATGPAPTQTPLPPATLVPTEPPVPTPPDVQTAAGGPPAEGVLSPTPFLSGALLPVALVVGGVGVAVSRQVRRERPEQPEDKESHRDAQ